MQKSIVQGITHTVILILLFTICFYLLSKTGIQPLWAAAGIVLIRGIFRFLFRIAVILVSVAIFLLLIGLLIAA